ncbi:receptor-type tyrosine-protein phosphatase eta-like [Styela clava]
MFVLNFGKYYTVNIITTYEEIDTEKVRRSDTLRTFYSRPDKPTIKVLKHDGKVSVGWTMVDGADGFHLQIQEVRSGRMILQMEGGRGFIEYKVESSHFIVGRYYRFSVTAITKDKKIRLNAVEKLMGDQLVPRQAIATLNTIKPCNSVDITWESPEKEPFRYKVLSTDGKHVMKHIKTNSCVVTGLQSGSRYRFNVIAIFEDGTESDPCSTDEIVTDPRPTTLENLQLRINEDRPHSSIMASWNRSENATTYKISVKTTNFLLEYTTDKTCHTLENLDSDTKYEICVSPGNSEGYGRQASSEITTELNPPDDASVTCSCHDCVDVSFVHNHTGTCQYEISLCKAENDEVVNQKKTSEIKCDFHNLEGNTEYYATVRSIKDAKSSRSEKSKNILTVPKKIMGLKCIQDDERPSLDVEIQWESEYPSMQYEVEVQTDQIIERLFLVADAKNCKYRCLKEGNLYSVRVRGKNKTGYSEWSNTSDILLGASPSKF